MAGKTTFDLSSPSKDASLEITLNGAKSTIRLDSTTLAASGTDLTKVSTDHLLTAINGQIANNAALKDKVVASTSPDGRITFASTATGSGSTLTVAGSANSTLDIGYGKSSTPPTPSTVTAQGVLAATTDFTTGSASLVVSDGNTSVQIRLDKNSKTDDLGGTLGPRPRGRRGQGDQQATQGQRLDRHGRTLRRQQSRLQVGRCRPPTRRSR